MLSRKSEGGNGSVKQHCLLASLEVAGIFNTIKERKPGRIRAAMPMRSKGRTIQFLFFQAA